MNPFLFWFLAPVLIWSYVAIAIVSATEDAADYAGRE